MSTFLLCPLRPTSLSVLSVWLFQVLVSWGTLQRKDWEVRKKKKNRWDSVRKSAPCLVLFFHSVFFHLLFFVLIQVPIFTLPNAYNELNSTSHNYLYPEQLPRIELNVY